jgi:hypothetical protein
MVTLSAQIQEVLHLKVSRYFNNNEVSITLTFLLKGMGKPTSNPSKDSWYEYTSHDSNKAPASTHSPLYHTNQL